MQSIKLPSTLITSLLALSLAGCFQEEPRPQSDESETGADDVNDDESETGKNDENDENDDNDDDDDNDDEMSGDGDGDDEGETSCSTEGCDCSDDAGSCEDGLYCSGEGLCTAPVCGNGEVEPGEQCDDNNTIDGDGCDVDCSFTEVLAVDASLGRSCVLIEGGRVRCWGQNYSGQLGYGHTEPVGDDETPAEAGDVMLPEPGVQLTLGDTHTCILMADSAVRCWGSGSAGKLGYGNTNNIGDDEFPISIPDVSVGGPVLEIAAGGSHTCARLNNGKLRCWGANWDGQLGYGNTNMIGDDEPPSAAGDVPVGSAVVHVATGIYHTCAITANGMIRCWGYNGSGQLGYGNTTNIGAEHPASYGGNVPAIPMGLPATTKATALALGLGMSCALYDSGDVLCWGSNYDGQLGQGHTNNIGDDEFPAIQPPIDLGGKAVAITTGDNHVCALLESKEVVCWGYNGAGQLGYGHTDPIGDNETPASAGVVQLGGPVRHVDAGGNHTCAVLEETNEVRCWGINSGGELGQGHTDNIGDDELPLDADPVPLF